MPFDGEGESMLVDLGDLGWDTDESVPAVPMPKGVKRLPSMLVVDPEVDLRVPSHARYVADCDGEVRDVVDKLAVGRTQQLYPDDMPWGDSSLQLVRNVFEKILKSDFKTVRTNMRKGVTEKALEMPIRSAYYQCQPLYNDPSVHIVVLDVTMGKELLHMYQANGNHRLNCHVHLVMRSGKPKTMHRLNWWNGCTYEGRLHLHPHDELPTVDDDEQKLCFSRVFCDLSIGYWLATETRKVNLFNWLDNHLGVGGEFLGSYVNPESVRHFEIKTRGQESSLGLVEFRDPVDGWDHGTVLVRVENKTFEDGRIPYDALVEACGRKNLSLGTPGLKFMERYVGWKTPARFKKFIRSAEVSCVDLVYIRRPALLVCDPFPIKSTWIPSLRALPTTGVPLRQGGTRGPSWNFPMNHGKILGPGDINFLRPGDQLLAFKQDGISGKLVIMDSKARLLLAHRAGDAVHECNVQFGGSILAQVEVKVDGQGFIERVWILDVFDCPGMTESDDFIARYTRGWDLIKKFKLPGVMCQEWVPYTASTFVEMAEICGRKGREGIVFQSRRAPRGSFENHLGSARYWKPRDRLTVDKAVGNQVFEYYLDGTRVRERPDKSVGNTPGQIAEVEAALDKVELMAIMDTSDHEVEVAGQVVEAMLSESLDVPPEVAVALLHPNRGRGTIFLEMIERGIVSSELEASHVLARFSGIIEELASDANVKLIRSVSRLKWYDPDKSVRSYEAKNMKLSELVEEDLCDLVVYD